MVMILGCYGYATFLPGFWDTGDSFTYYAMVFGCIGFYLFWKIVMQSKMVDPLEADLVWEAPIIDAEWADWEEWGLSTYVQSEASATNKTKLRPNRNMSLIGKAKLRGSSGE